jgi:hypothetical protein
MSRRCWRCGGSAPTPDSLARDHGISRATAYRYRDEVIAVLAGQAPDLRQALERAKDEGLSHWMLSQGESAPANDLMQPAELSAFNWTASSRPPAPPYTGQTEWTAARGNLRVMTGWEDGAAQRPGLDMSRPNIARVYDYWLGGKDNFEADREEAERLLRIYPDLRRLAQENRLFLRRAVHWLAADCGIRQFLDIGSGLPTVSNTHDVAQAAAPDSKVAYVDKDPVVVLHADRLLADGHDVIAVRGDAAEPAAILADPCVNTLVQPGRPYAVILAAVLHFSPLAVARRILTEFAGLAPPGSYLIISVGSSGGGLAREYAAGTLHDHSPDEIRTLLTGLEIIDPPGLVDALHWAPRTPAPAPARPGGRILAAVAQTPARRA